MHCRRCSESCACIYLRFYADCIRLHTLNEHSYVQKDSKFIRAIWKSDILSSRWHHTFHYFWSPFLRLFSSSVKGSRDSHGRSAKAFGLALCSLYRGPFSTCTIQLFKKTSTPSLRFSYVLSLLILWCFDVFWCRITQVIQRWQNPAKNQWQIPVWFTSGVQAAHWASGATNGGPAVRGAKLLGQRHDFVSSFAGLKGWIHNPTFEQRVGEKPMLLQIKGLFVWDIMCDSHSSGAEPCGACRACSPCNAAEIWRTDPQQ